MIIKEDDEYFHGTIRLVVNYKIAKYEGIDEHEACVYTEKHY